MIDKRYSPFNKPNIQNITPKTELGNRIKEAFLNPNDETPTNKIILSRLKTAENRKVEVRIEYIESDKEWEVNLRNRNPDAKIGDWHLWGTGRAFSLNDAITLAFNEANRRGY